jgi:ribosomal protein S27AE
MIDRSPPSRPDEIAIAKESKHCPRCISRDRLDIRKVDPRDPDVMTNHIARCECGFAF